MNYDAFLSYKSNDHNLANRLKKDLQRRGVRLWLDQDDIKPGDEFPDALKDGIQTSRRLVLLVTPESLRSKWVQSEIRRARKMEVKWKKKIIPLLFRDATLPPDLEKRQRIDFRRDTDFARGVTKLVWPGITGKRVVFVAVHPGDTSPWQALDSELQELGLTSIPGEDIDRAWRRLKEYFGKSRVVAVVDLFEDWPRANRCRNTPQQYADWIRKVRERTMETPDKVVFLLHHHSEAWGSAENHLDASADQELRRFYTLYQDVDRADLRKGLQAAWFKIQRDLLETERRFET